MRVADFAVPSLAAALLGLSGCGGAESPPPATVTATVPVTVTATPSATATATAAVPAATPPASAPTTSPSAAAMVTVPDFTQTSNYQQAQDLAQKVGLVVLPATDARGLDRIPVLDTNWIVVGQNLAAGSQVASGSSVTMTVQKTTD